jgi:hypothetical protein
MTDIAEDERPREEMLADLRVAQIARERFVDYLDSLARDGVGIFHDAIRTSVPFYQARADFPVVTRAAMHTRGEEFRNPRLMSEWPCKPPITFTNGTVDVPLEVTFDLVGYYDQYHFSYARILSTIPGFIDSLEPDRPAVLIFEYVPIARRITYYLPSLGGATMRALPSDRSPEDDAATVAYLRGIRVPALHGKPYELLRLIDLDRKHPNPGRIRPELVFTSGDKLYPSYRARLEAYFECPVIDVVSTTEGGILAVQCRHSNTLHIQTDRVIVESERGDSSASSWTDDVFITNLMNRGQAFVRYKQGDRATVVDGDCECGHSGPSFTSFAGRDAQSFRASRDNIVEAPLLETVLDISPVKHFVVRQTGAEKIIVQWVPESDATRDATAARLNRELHDLLGDAFELRETDEISVHGGKLRRFVRTD